MRVYCCDFQSSKLRKHSEVGLGLTYNVAALRLLGLVNLRLKKQLLKFKSKKQNFSHS